MEKVIKYRVVDSHGKIYFGKPLMLCNDATITYV